LPFATFVILRAAITEGAKTAPDSQATAQVAAIFAGFPLSRLAALKAEAAVSATFIVFLTADLGLTTRAISQTDVSLFATLSAAQVRVVLSDSAVLALAA
jgi:hypothetical protein